MLIVSEICWLSYKSWNFLGTNLVECELILTACMVYVVPAGLNCGCIPLTEKKTQSLSKPLFTGKGLPTRDIHFLKSMSYVMF